MAVEGADISVRCERTREVVRPWNAGRLKERNQIDSDTFDQTVWVTLEPNDDEVEAKTVVSGSDHDRWFSIQSED